MSQFFGTLSPFDVIVAFVAIVTGVYTFCKSFFESPKISLYPADTIGLVISPNGLISAFHLACNLVNSSAKTGTLHHLEIYIPHSAPYEPNR